VLGDPPVPAADLGARIDEHRHNVHVFERLERRAVQLLAQRVVRLVQTWRVDEHDLRVVTVEHRAQPVPGRLRRVGRDGDLGAHHGVGQSRLSRVGPSDQRDEAAPGLLGAQAFRWRFGVSH
jgi:hypothetical protein